MTSPINPDRLAQTFRELVSIDSISQEERDTASLICRVLGEEIGADIHEDDTRGLTGSNSGNIIAKIPGDDGRPALFFNAHLDTVEPGRGIKVLFKDGVFSSDGTTVLGSDDKAAGAILIEVARVLRETGQPHGPLEFVFTVCEEIGLLGSKALDTSLLQAKTGYALDSTDTGILIHKAPAAIRFKVSVIGKAAHAGLNPELGINAIQVAAKALADVRLGRIDRDTTANIGTIRGGTATNIVPEQAVLEGEVRSHNEKRLREVQDEILGAFQKIPLERMAETRQEAAHPEPPFVKTEVLDDYPLMSVPEEHPLITTAVKSAQNLGRQLRLERTGGGSDANILNGKGLSTIIMGVGMQKVHTTEEFIRLDDMVLTAELVLEIIREWGKC